jgi:hypothetical protein
MKMKLSSRLGPFALMAMAALLATAGCKSNQDQNTAYSGQGGVQDVSQDPAAVNQAPVTSDTGTAQPAAYTAQQSAPPADGGGAYQQAQGQSSDDSDYGEQPVEYAPDPPPPLPDYDQPPAPGDDYLWTPGYWNYAQAGYYWVPGVWVQAPYEGALWTPGYWGWSHNRYGFHRGYWGRHIGYYGGIDYGFGYVGFGYQGGYWNGGHFNYNRSVNNVNLQVVHNVYNFNVERSGGGSRISFNGGQGGIQVRARPAELAAFHEPHAAPMSAQVQNERSAGSDRAQFANVNHGRPANPVAAHPLVADRGVRAPAPMEMHGQPAAQQHGPAEMHQNAPQPVRMSEPAPHQAEPQRMPQPQHQEAPQRQAMPLRQAEPQRQEVPQRQATPQHQAAQERQAPQQHQAAPQQQAQPQHQTAPQQQRAAPPQAPQHQAAPQHAAAPPQHQAAAPQHQAAPQKPEEHPKK